MSIRSGDLATRMVDLLDDTSELEDARDAARLLAALFSETTGATQVALHVRVPEPDRFVTLGVLGHQHFSSTLVIPSDSPGLIPLLHRTEPLWARTRHESHETMLRFLGENTDRAPALDDTPPHLLFSTLHTPQRVVGAVLLGSGPDGFRLGDTSLVSLLARLSGAVLARARVATVFDESGRLAALPLHPSSPPAATGPTPTETFADLRSPEGPVPGSPSRRTIQRSTALTARQLEVLVRIADGMTNAQIAEDLALSIHTVRTHRRHLMASFEARTSTALVARARAAGSLPS